MTPEQTQKLHTLAVVAAALGLVETLLAFILGLSQKTQTKNLRYMLLVAGPGFLVAAAILYWGGIGYLPTMIAAFVAVAIGSNVGVLHMVRAAKKSAGNQFP